MKAILTRGAKRDMVLAAADIAENSPRSAERFVEAVEDAAARIGRHPEIGNERRDLIDPPLRIWPLTRYGFLVLYDSGRRPPHILRIPHGARDLPELLSDYRA